MAWHGETMGEVYTSSSWDTIRMLAEVWKSVPPEDSDTVVKPIRKLRYEGISGTHTFHRPGQRPLNYPWETGTLAESIPHQIHQVQDGKHTIILPAELAEAGYVTPSWAR